MAPVSGMTPSSCLQQRDPGAYSYMLHDTLNLGAYSRASCTPAQPMNTHPSYAVSGASPHSAGEHFVTNIYKKKLICDCETHLYYFAIFKEIIAYIAFFFLFALIL